MSDIRMGAKLGLRLNKILAGLRKVAGVTQPSWEETYEFFYAEALSQVVDHSLAGSPKRAAYTAIMDDLYYMSRASYAAYALQAESVRERATPKALRQIIQLHNYNGSSRSQTSGMFAERWRLMDTPAGVSHYMPSLIRRAPVLIVVFVLTYTGAFYNWADKLTAWLTAEVPKTELFNNTPTPDIQEVAPHILVLLEYLASVAGSLFVIILLCSIMLDILYLSIPMLRGLLEKRVSQAAKAAALGDGVDRGTLVSLSWANYLYNLANAVYGSSKSCDEDNTLLPRTIEQFQAAARMEVALDVGNICPKLYSTPQALIQEVWG